MSFDWRLYLQLADELITYQRTANLQEAYYRSAISRSYYGVFCIARNFLVSKGVIIPRKRTHTFVREKYQYSQNRVEKKIGDNLGRLWRRRKEADYEDKVKVDIHRTQAAYQLSFRTFRRLHQIGAI